MGWIEKTSFAKGTEKLSYSRLIKIFGEDKGKLVAAHFGIKKDKKKKED